MWEIQKISTDEGASVMEKTAILPKSHRHI
jgi:hypothetical protein